MYINETNIGYFVISIMGDIKTLWFNTHVLCQTRYTSLFKIRGPSVSESCTLTLLIAFRMLLRLQSLSSSLSFSRLFSSFYLFSIQGLATLLEFDPNS